MEQSGFLLVEKPAGMTSHDVVDAVRRARGTRRVGHAGTLDPLATGLLIIAVGPATKELGRFLTLPKTYEAEITLGATSTTDDTEGARREASIANQESGKPTREDVARALQGFSGTIEQVPPAYSAVKTRGVPAYRRARRGEVVTLKPRRVTIHARTLLAYAYPHLRIRCTVSSGTYIRALARDLGARLGTGGYLSALTRTAIGPYHRSDAVSLANVGTAALRDLRLDGGESAC